MKVRIIRQYGIYRPGTVMNISPKLACRWIADGVAEPEDVVRTETLEAPERAVMPRPTGYRG